MHCMVILHLQMLLYGRQWLIAKTASKIRLAVCHIKLTRDAKEKAHFSTETRLFSKNGKSYNFLLILVSVLRIFHVNLKITGSSKYRFTFQPCWRIAKNNSFINKHHNFRSSLAFVTNPFDARITELLCYPYEIDVGNFQIQLLDLKNTDMWQTAFNSNVFALNLKFWRRCDLSS